MSSDSNFTLKFDILVIDDNRENLRLLSTMLSDCGYKVRKAINGNLALRAIDVAKPDLILLDINMPEINGYEVCRRLKANPSTATIPIIFISALDEVLDKVKAFEIGGIDYITKPFEIQEVLVRVKNQLTIFQQKKELLLQQEQLTERNAKLQLLLTTTVAISEADNFISALEVTLSQVCEKIGWDFGEFWLPNSQASVFELGQGWYSSEQQFETFRNKSKALTFATNRDVLRQICLSQQPRWIIDVSVEPGDIFQRNQLAQEVGLKTCLGVPILFNKKVLAVWVFFKQDASLPNLQVIELVNALATQLGSLIQRKHSESALSESQRQLAAMVANIPGCVYRGVVHPDGRTKLLYISEGEHELSGLSPQKAMAELERLLGTLPPDSQANFYEALKASAQSNKPVTQEYPVASPDGKVKWVRNSARYSLMDNGDVMIDGVAIDISDCLRNSVAVGTRAVERIQLLENAIAEGTTSLQSVAHDSLTTRDFT